MRKLFQLWLLIVVVVAFVIALGLSFKMQTALALNSARLMLQQKLNDALILYERRQQNLEVIREISRDTALAKITAFERCIFADPSLLTNQQKLEQVRRELNVDELHVTDEKGVIKASSGKDYVNYNMAEKPQSRAFLKALDDKDFVLVQSPQPNGFEERIMQYVGIARKDRPGIIQIGFTPERLLEAEKLAELAQIEAVVKIGEQGTLQITPHRDSPPEQRQAEQFYEAVKNGKRSLCAIKINDQAKFEVTIPLAEIFEHRNTLMKSITFYNLLLFGVIFCLVSFLLQRVVIQGIFSINQSLKKITEGNLNEKVNVTKTVEFEALSNGINATVQALKQSMQAEAQRIHDELEAGKTIQRAMLTTDFPTAPGNQVFAFMEAAREVGGDFYDIITVDQDREALLIADVSGKGLTAALTMMNTKTLIKQLIEDGKEPAQALTLANREICRNNPAQMFVTAFLAVLDVKSRRLTCVNAGHNPPLLQREGQAWDYLRIKHSIALGVTESARYVEVSLQLAPHDRLLFYTDGVTEAQDCSGTLYGETQLRESLDRLQVSTPQELITRIRSNLAEHAHGEPQSDDITMLALFV